jgi:hypothetical protein
MLRKTLAVMIGATLWAVSVGCDETAMSALPDDLSKLVAAARGANGDVLMDRDQIQQRDQLRDGTGADCPKAGTAERGIGDQVRDQLRLQDGTGANCPR